MKMLENKLPVAPLLNAIAAAAAECEIRSIFSSLSLSQLLPIIYQSGITHHCSPPSHCYFLKNAQLTDSPNVRRNAVEDSRKFPGRTCHDKPSFHSDITRVFLVAFDSNMSQRRMTRKWWLMKISSSKFAKGLCTAIRPQFTPVGRLVITTMP